MQHVLFAVLHHPESNEKRCTSIIEKLKLVFPESPPFIFTYANGIAEDKIPNGCHYLKLPANHNKQKGLCYLWQNVRLIGSVLGKPWILILNSEIDFSAKELKKYRELCEKAMKDGNKTLAYIDELNDTAYNINVALLSGKALSFFAPLSCNNIEGGIQMKNNVIHYKAQEFINPL